MASAAWCSPVAAHSRWVTKVCRSVVRLSSWRKRGLREVGQWFSGGGTGVRLPIPARLHNPVMPAYKLAPNAAWTATESRWERRLERSCIANRLAGFGLECGFPAAVLLPAVAVVVAGRDQGGVSRTGKNLCPIPSGGAQPAPRHEAAPPGTAQAR